MLPCICSVIDHRWGQNVVRTKNLPECVTDVLTTLWRHLWSITKQTHGNVESTWGPKYAWRDSDRLRDEPKYRYHRRHRPVTFCFTWSEKVRKFVFIWNLCSFFCSDWCDDSETLSWGFREHCLQYGTTRYALSKLQTSFATGALQWFLQERDLMIKGFVKHFRINTSDIK